jgi:hypothetical protein
MSIFKTILSPITDIVSKAVVDVDKKKEIELQMREILDRADARYHTELMAQTEINKVEAGHASVFVAGWRPFIGWTSGVGLAYVFVLAPFIEFFARLNGYDGPVPHPNTNELMALVMAMLGIGGMRTYEKAKGVSRGALKEEGSH